ncbi:biotin--acetyl-CoA-carboxylase ligase [Marinobacterium iners]|uniref:FxsA family protein n=1 Tax=Marinobacterium iners TaxID=48076 RepID=UPI001A8D1D3B|nr:FxsA family protein [Marinobacterium iners]QSR34053.1 biotin--acetyl-CoA-carboxylase ligase [Marinobacterium iners]
MRVLFLLFIIIPIIEITVLIQVGQAIGAWYTVGLVLLSAFIGVNMLRHQGLSTLARAQQRMDQGEVPGQEMAEGILLAVGGALLVTPGFVTDVIGFSCLIPAARCALIKPLIGRFTVVAATHRNQTEEMHVYTADPDDYRTVEERDPIEGEITHRDR